MAYLSRAAARAPWWLVWAWAAFILFCSSDVAGAWADGLYGFFFGGGPPGSGLLRMTLQKGFHIFLFVFLGVFAAVPAGLRKPLACVAICVGFGTGSEAFQALWPSRTPAFGDIVINVASGLAACSWALRLQGKESRVARVGARLAEM